MANTSRHDIKQFIDRVVVEVKAGNGGDGCMSFRREKFVPRGGPDGGNGGRGGDVNIEVDPHMRTLLDLRYRKRYRAVKGRPGQGSRKTGRSGSHVTMRVPPGTVIEDFETGEQMADLTEAGEKIVVAKGGRGGKGNYGFRSASNQAPRKFTKGEAGEERNLVLTLKVLADVGLVGLPNAGKSTLLRSVSDAHPVVAEYPFSTKVPVLGIVRIGEGESFCMVDIPGLIEGAHRGKGLGIQFLRHIERCRMLIFVIDAGGEVPPDEAYRQLIDEIVSYRGELAERPRMIALNKIDLLPSAGADIEFSACSGEEVLPISALEGTGLRELIFSAYRIISDGA